MAQTGELTELLQPVVEQAGLFLETVELSRAGRYSTLRVVVDLADGPGSLDLDQVSAVSEAISQALDEADPIKSQYTLEVTSPGAERELTTPRHYRRALGRQVELQLRQGEQTTQVSGELLGCEGQLEVATSQGVMSIDPADVVQARQVVVF